MPPKSAPSRPTPSKKVPPKSPNAKKTSPQPKSTQKAGNAAPIPFPMLPPPPPPKTIFRMTPSEIDRKQEATKVIRILKKRHHIPSDASINPQTDEKHLQLEKSKKNRYRTPVERLLKHIKTVRRRRIPSDINLHRHTHRSDAFVVHPGVRKQVDIIRKVFIKHKKPVQPQFGYNYPKKDRRLLLGFRHRPLKRGCQYFNIFKCLARRIRPNDHVPDMLFFFIILLMFLSTGFLVGCILSMDGFLALNVDIYEYSLFRENSKELETPRAGEKFWEKKAPFYNYNPKTTGFLIIFYVAQFLGIIGIYTADQRLHLGYIIGTILSLGLNGYYSFVLVGNDYCTATHKIMTPLLTLLLENYYETVPAKSENGTIAKDASGKDIYLRTYGSANIMDRLQMNLHCCGVKNIKDYASRGLEVPSSCCNPLWNLNPYCAHGVPIDGSLPEYRAKLRISKDVDIGCDQVLHNMCQNFEQYMGLGTFILCLIHGGLFLVSLIPLLMQVRQIRQLKRRPHLRITKGNISQSLQASGGGTASKAGVKAVAEATTFTEKQQERAQQMKMRDNIAKNEGSGSSSSDSTIFEQDEETEQGSRNNFGSLKQLQSFVGKEDDELDADELDQRVVGFSGRFNIVAKKQKHLVPYAPAIFSTTYTNETNIGLEAITQTLEREFAQHTTNYHWKLKTTNKPKEDPKLERPNLANFRAKKLRRKKTQSEPALDEHRKSHDSITDN